MSPVSDFMQLAVFSNLLGFLKAFVHSSIIVEKDWSSFFFFWCFFAMPGKKCEGQFVGIKAKGRISKQLLQSTPNFPKKEHFSPLTTVLRFALLPHYRRIEAMLLRHRKVTSEEEKIDSVFQTVAIFYENPGTVGVRLCWAEVYSAIFSNVYNGAFYKNSESTFCNYWMQKVKKPCSLFSAMFFSHFMKK